MSALRWLVQFLVVQEAGQGGSVWEYVLVSVSLFTRLEVAVSSFACIAVAYKVAFCFSSLR